MNSSMRKNDPSDTRPSPPIEGFDSLAELALDMRWSWNHATDDLWRELDPELWQVTQNPWVVLQTAAREKVDRMLADPAFRKRADGLVQTRREEARAPAWFQTQDPLVPLTAVAYFSLELMLSEALPIYAGGLGNVAGDQLKAASDLGVPVVGVGLLYSQGYFRQVIDKDGEQQSLYPYNDPGQLPITPLRGLNGECLRLKIDLPAHPVWLRAWQVQVGRVKLYLLDSNDPANLPANRGITSELYGGGPALRLKQELLLGIGGWRLLDALGIKPEVCHLNEGHAAFAVLERARSFMLEAGQPFEVALTATRVGNLFTTHTAVPAGFDRFEPSLIERYLRGYAEQKLGIKMRDLLALGRQNPDDASESFNMAYLAVRGSGSVNGVSLLHGQVSRSLFEPLFRHWPVDEVPVGHVTNGVHAPTWDSAAADDLWTAACGKGRWLGALDGLERQIEGLSDASLWDLRTTARASLVKYARERVTSDSLAAGASSAEVEAARHLFDPGVLTLGFARRFATYKRPDLLLHDPDRLLRLLSNPKRPVQLIMAGKAHPADRAGQDLIREWIQFIQRPEAAPHVIFVGDYDMRVTGQLVQGVDLWLNTPRRPWEACGTSGMKVLVNGGLNFSILDGWWAEAYELGEGWALGDGREHGDDPGWDAADAVALYDRLEQEIIPEFYARNDQGIPTAWVERMRKSMARLTPRFSAHRAVRDYTERYLLAAAAHKSRTAGRGAVATQIVHWKSVLDEKWARIHFGSVTAETRGAEHFVDVEVGLDDLAPTSVSVELYADGSRGHRPVRQEMKRGRNWVDRPGGYVFSAAVSAARPIADYTARVIPHHDALAIPLEEARILWQR